MVVIPNQVTSYPSLTSYLSQTGLNRGCILKRKKGGKKREYKFSKPYFEDPNRLWLLLILMVMNQWISYNVNDLVMIKNRKLSSKAKEYTASLDSVWKGPFVIKEKKGFNTYVIFTMDGTPKEIGVYG